MEILTPDEVAELLRVSRNRIILMARRWSFPRLKIKPKTIKNKMASGIFRKGVHYFSPKGLSPRFKWSAVVAWLEEREKPPAEQSADAIPMARGYLLGSGKKLSTALDSF
jgi:hypothetical protein